MTPRTLTTRIVRTIGVVTLVISTGALAACSDDDNDLDDDMDAPMIPNDSMTDNSMMDDSVPQIGTLAP